MENPEDRFSRDEAQTMCVHNQIILLITHSDQSLHCLHEALPVKSDQTAQPESVTLQSELSRLMGTYCISFVSAVAI